MAINLIGSEQIRIFFYKLSQQSKTTRNQLLMRDHDHTKLVRLKCQPSLDIKMPRPPPSTILKSNIKMISINKLKFNQILLVVIHLSLVAQICLCDRNNNNQNNHNNKLPVNERIILDQIERQHFGAIANHHRPTSLYDYDRSDTRFTPTSTNSFNQLSVNHIELPEAKKAEENMRHIMKLHEQIANNQIINQHNQVIPSSDVTPQGSEQINGASRGDWRELVKSPVKTASAIMNPSKLVSHVLSFVSPLINSKKTGGDEQTTTGFTRARALNSFYGRAFGGGIRSKPSKLEETKTAQSSSWPRVTLMPQNLFLSKPEQSPIHKEFVTQSTPMISGQKDQVSGHSITKMAYRTAKRTIKPSDTSVKDPMIESASNLNGVTKIPLGTTSMEVSPAINSPAPTTTTGGHLNLPIGDATSKSWIKMNKNPGYLQNSLKDFLVLSQLPILAGGPISTAPSVLERGGKLYGVKVKGVNETSVNSFQSQSLKAIDDLLRLAYILGTGLRRKRDPLKALGSHANPLYSIDKMASAITQRSLRQFIMPNFNNSRSLTSYTGDTSKRLRSMVLSGLQNNAKPRGVMWDMATDPSLAVTVFHLIERASVALPLGFLLMPMVRMIRNPLNGFNLGRVLPPRASHRSVELEELAKRLDTIDKILSRALRPTHREAFIGK